MWLVTLTNKLSPEQIKYEWFDEHIYRNDKLRETGLIVANGPFIDGSGGSILFDCGKEQMETLVKEDPLVINQVVDYECKEWKVEFSTAIIL